MGTRSLTFVYDGVNPVVNMYRQYDGYPEGHGAELASFLKQGQLVNGVPLGENGHFFNGVGCLAAQMVASFKDGVGGIYLYPATAIDCGQDYEYHIQVVDKGFHIRVVNRGMNFFGMTQSDTNEVIFEGNLEEFTKFCQPANSFELNDDEVEKLKQNLQKGVVEVTFEKNDGSTRVMKCTLSENIIPISTETTKAVVKKKQPNPDVLPVWDIESKGWRSFRWDSISSARVV